MNAPIVCSRCHERAEFPSQQFCAACGHPLHGQQTVASSPLPKRKRAESALSEPSPLRPLPATRSLREIYFELGTALSSENRHEDAVQALEQAANEKGKTPRSFELGTTRSRVPTSGQPSPRVPRLPRRSAVRSRKVVGIVRTSSCLPHAACCADARSVCR